MGDEGKNFTLENLQVYMSARLLSKIAWQIFDKFDWKLKKIIGDQFIESTDSVGANIAEGYGRFHYLDKIKFFYNARGSLLESKHWIELIVERRLSADKALINNYLKTYEELKPKLNNIIKSLYKNKFTPKSP